LCRFCQPLDPVEDKKHQLLLIGKVWHEFGHLLTRGFNAHIASTKDGGRRTRKRQREEVQFDTPPHVAPTTRNKKIVSEAGYAMEEAVFGGRLSHISEQHLFNIVSVVITRKEGKKLASYELDEKYLSCQKATVASYLPDFNSLQKIKGQRREKIYKGAYATDDVVVRKLLIFEGHGNTTESGRKSAPIVIW
jgi:hypothetical protein